MNLDVENINFKEELEEKEEKENSKLNSIHINSNNSQEISNKSKSKEALDKIEEKNNSINLFKNSISSKNSSNQKINQRYNGNENDNREEIKIEDNNQMECNAKFMQINPHFNIFNKQIDSLRDSIYDDTKRCLMLKGSLQQSSNFLKEESNNLIKDIVEKIYNLRELFEKGNKGLNQTTQEVQEGLKKLKDVQSKARKEIIQCDKRITQCEDQIGYKLLGNPNYSFMKNYKIKKVNTLK